MKFIIIFLLLLIIAAAGGFAAFFYVRRIYREQKNYERGLKMVPLLIHLPPMSEDVEVSAGRDQRDIVEENISRAQVLYSILASTYKKGFKSGFYGQRHLCLEIIADEGVVKFYAAVPVTLVSVFKQAVVSAYPSAVLEDKGEHNIFSSAGKITGTLGGELALKEKFAYPIATYQDLKRDTIQAFLNSLSTLQKDDGAAIQISLRPADGSWRKIASQEADKKRKGKKTKKGYQMTFWWVQQLFTALWKPPEAKDDKGGGSSESSISTLNQAVIEAIEEKTKHPGYEVMIRLVVSTPAPQRSQQILSNMVAAFSLFDAPGKNGFKFIPAKDIDSFVSAYILRFFPQENDKNILNSVEIATLFHFPDQKNIPTTQLERQSSKMVDGPRNVPDKGLLLGYNVYRGVKKPIRLSDNDRRRHMYIVGQTGTGKSWFLTNLALQDMLSGRGFAFVDPHGDAVEDLLAMVPKERTEDVIYFNPSDMDYPLGLNMFEYHNPDQKDFLIQESINMLYKLYDPQHQSIIGPRYEHIFRNAALAIMADPEGGTFVDIPKLFRDNKFIEQKLQHVTDKTVLEFWRKEFPASQRSNDSGEINAWFVSKFGAFLSNEMMRNIIGQTKSSFNMREIMDEGKILLVNLSKGKTGDLNSKLLGMIFVMKFQAAAMSRANIPESDRKDFSLYVDEFQNFSTDSFAEILSEARKYRLNLIVANQFTTQLSDEIRDAVFGNVGTLITHRVGTADAEALVKIFRPIFDEEDLQGIPNFNTVVRMLIDGVPTQPFSMANLPLLGKPNPQLNAALKQLSAAKYGRPKAVVESEIFKRLETKEDIKPAGLGGDSPFDRFMANQPAGMGASPAPRASSGAPASSGSSFLDEWLAKRQAASAAAPAPSQAAVPQQPSTPAPAINPTIITPDNQKPADNSLKIDRSSSDTTSPAA